MTSRRRDKETVEFGDFQTPGELAEGICRLVSRLGAEPASILEPTCGTGSILVAALRQFGGARHAIGLDINPRYVREAGACCRRGGYGDRTRLICADFFRTDWQAVLRSLPDPLLVVGNPPWVTNADLATLGSLNLPPKSNFQKRKGLDARMGKSNFDISEWMLIQTVEWLGRRNALMAMLCKTSVARKVLLNAWRSGLSPGKPQMYVIDAGPYFGAAVDACLFVCTFGSATPDFSCAVYDSLEAGESDRTIGYRDGQLVADLATYERLAHLGGESRGLWRSGIKHDCARVMELEKEGARYRNGLGELVDLEDDYLFPMLKSSDVARGAVTRPRRWMIVTQSRIGEDTSAIGERAAKTWEYLCAHAELLDRRASSMHSGRARFSIFGVGPYSFAPWKVAVSGFHSRAKFAVVGNAKGRPYVLDDTCYLLPCSSRSEARYLASLLNSQTAVDFFSALTFCDAKRPVTADLLGRLDLLALARETGTESTMLKYLARREEQLRLDAPES